MAGFKFPSRVSVLDLQGKLIEDKIISDVHEAKIQIKKSGLYFI